MDPDELLKQAASRKKAGDFDEAVRLLKQAYRAISNSSIIYSIENFLRLPMYLVEAKKYDEAWKEFNNLLTIGYPNQLNDPEVLHMERSIVYDKMRLALQREGKNKAAIRFGIFAFLSRAIGLHIQRRTDEFRSFTSNKNIQKTVKTLLKKAEREDLVNLITTVIQDQIKAIPRVNFSQIANNIDELLVRGQA